jgi:hypothetical protein
MMVTLIVLRRRVTQVCGALFLSLAALEFLLMALGRDWSVFTLIKELIMVALGTGLLLGNAFARRATALLLVLVAIGLPLGYMNPFNASDMMAGQGTAPSVPAILLWMVPLETFLIFAIWAVDPLKPKGNGAAGAADPKP